MFLEHIVVTIHKDQTDGELLFKSFDAEGAIYKIRSMANGEYHWLREDEFTIWGFDEWNRKPLRILIN